MIDSTDLLDFASKLAVNPAAGNTEVRHRSAVSKAYFAAFHAALEFLSEFGVNIPKNHLGHNLAYTTLSATDVDDAMSAAQTMNDLRGRRNQADYDLDVPRVCQSMNNQRNVMLLVQDAGEVHSRLQRCREEPQRSKIEQHFLNNHQ